MTGEYRQYLYEDGHPRITELHGLDTYSYQSVAERPGSFTGELIAGWRPLYRAPFTGVTSDGTVIDDLYSLRDDVPPEERAPLEAMVEAAQKLLRVVSEEDRDRLCYDVDAVEWQTWANPEFLQFDTGLRLENVDDAIVQAVYGLIAASTSERGNDLIRAMMRINGFLGDVVGLPAILGELSYNAALYGKPSTTQPWGWQLYGHHCAVNCLVIGGQMVISPVFLGAEPNEIDEGRHAGTVAFSERIALGRALMAELTDDQRAAATTYGELVDPAMPEGRVHPGDERHLAGAFQDNRVIPYEGVRVADLSATAQDLVWQIVADFVSLLPEGPARARVREAQDHVADTWFSWIGGHGPEDPYYFRIQSPVIIAELDHHCGVFLTNETPQPFHIHTVLRTPNGNDYGRALVRQWQNRA